MRKFNLKIMLSFILLFAVVFLAKTPAYASSATTNVSDTTSSIIPSVNISVGGNDDLGQGQGLDATLQLLFLITIISLAPSILVMMTCFTRLIISLHFLRSALGTQQMPPNQVLIGLALFLTLFLMGPTFTKINETALQPLSRQEISQEEAITLAMDPVREFMFHQVKNKDLALFYRLDQSEFVSQAETPNRILIPAFILGEVTQGFIIGFIIYLPFIVIDMVVASVLMAMGMMMLPPAMISLPFKILLFVMIDGWGLYIEAVVKTFR